MIGMSAGVLTVLGTCLMFFTIGFNAIWGSMLTYYLSYFRITSLPDLTASSLNIMPTL
jgi:hypothetical protein